jgi:hypothetical protein
VTLLVVYEERALDQLAGFLGDDPPGVAALLDGCPLQPVGRGRSTVERHV